MALALPGDINVNRAKRTRVSLPIAKSDAIILVDLLDLEVVRLGAPGARPVNGANFGLAVVDAPKVQRISMGRQAAA